MSEARLVSEVPEVPVVPVVGFSAEAGEFGGYEVVILALEANDGEEQAVLNFALPSEDALRIARRLIHVASGVRPFQVQQRIVSLVEAGKENSSK